MRTQLLRASLIVAASLVWSVAVPAREPSPRVGPSAPVGSPSPAGAPATMVGAPSHDGQQRVADVGDLKLENGQLLRGCRVGFRTFGRLDTKKSNAVLFPTWFGGTSGDLIELIGAGKLIDSSRYYVIAVDALGNGVSSSPSNSAAHPRMRFPEISVRDMVASQHALVTRVLGLPRLRAVMGISMGGMQTFQWAVEHPTFMERAVTIVGSPQLAAYDLLLWQAELDAIFADPAWQGGDYTAQPLLRAVQGIHELALTTPEHYNDAHTRRGFLAARDKRTVPKLDANNRVRQLQAMMRHDVAAPYGGSLAEAAAQIRAPMLVVVDARDHMVTPGPALEFAVAVRARVLKTDTKCGHLVPSCERDKVAAAIADHLK